MLPQNVSSPNVSNRKSVALGLQARRHLRLWGQVSRSFCATASTALSVLLCAGWQQAVCPVNTSEPITAAKKRVFRIPIVNKTGRSIAILPGFLMRSCVRQGTQRRPGYSSMTRILFFMTLVEFYFRRLRRDRLGAATDDTATIQAIFSAHRKKWHAPEAAMGNTANTSRCWNRLRPYRPRIPVGPPPGPDRGS